MCTGFRTGYISLGMPLFPRFLFLEILVQCILDLSLDRKPDIALSLVQLVHERRVDFAVEH